MALLKTKGFTKVMPKHPTRGKMGQKGTD